MSVMGLSCYEDGFRLNGAPSECSIRSKARIDALFEDSRSVCSSTMGGWYNGVSTVNSAAHDDSATMEEQKRINSAVQARIEAMFASVEAESGTPGECAAAILPVKYMGAAPVGGRVASIRGLQEPLRQLVERMGESVKAELEVSRRGLTFRTCETWEKNNPFRRIAVWSALRLRCKSIGPGELHHAFLPLVGDTDQGQGGEDRHADLYRTMRGLKSDMDQYPPIFAVVMRRPGAARLLECHAFACETEEDAVAAAATLYRALLADLDANRRKPRHSNGLGCMSLASVASSAREVSPPINRNNHFLAAATSEKASDTPSRPVRPPRSKKHSTSSCAVEEEARQSTGVQKAPRRKKKSCEVRAEEDVFEARECTLDAPKVEKQSANSPRRKVECVENRKAEIQPNEKNFQAESRASDDVRATRNEAKLREENKCRVYEAKWNAYEKVAPRAKSNCDRIVDPNCRAIYLPGRGDQCASNGWELYCKRGGNRGSYDFYRDNTDLSDGRRDSCASLYDKLDKPSSILENSIYERANSRRAYEEQLRDADKIYSLDSSDVYGITAGERKERAARSRGSRENLYPPSTARKEENFMIHEEKRCSRSRERTCSASRLCRVVTMDKPLKKQHCSSGGSNNNNSNNNNKKNLTEDSKVPVGYGEPRVRRRSRAGSEPPVGRSQADRKETKETRLKRSQSDVDVERGDLMTRVELPRRGSFLKPGTIGRANDMKGGTPLGFTELFDEFRNQEGLTSVDDILAAIIDPEGMSFNDLKPLYKEFLLKLAATLTQDELYQRSASIMRRRRRPQRRRSTRRSCLLGRAIKRSVSRLKGGPMEFTSVIFPARRLNDSFGSSSSCDARNNHRNRVLTNRHGRRRSSWRAKKHGQCHTTSEDSDTCRRLSRNVGTGAANRSSSGYVSCSECSYDSESCTCVSADKCYCSLSRRVPAQPISLPTNAIVCACDTDSCSESNKCYCARSPMRNNILEQLRQKGIVPTTESTLSRVPSPDRIANRTAKSHAHSRSSDLLKKAQAPTACSSSDNLALDYDLFSPGRKSEESSNSEKVLVVSARDTQGRLVYVGGTEREKKSHGSIRSDSHHEALSIKKSAEIAAVFGSESNRTCRRVSNASSIRSTVSLEAGLGYLP